MYTLLSTTVQKTKVCIYNTAMAFSSLPSLVSLLTWSFNNKQKAWRQKNKNKTKLQTIEQVLKNGSPSPRCWAVSFATLAASSAKYSKNRANGTSPFRFSLELDHQIGVVSLLTLSTKEGWSQMVIFFIFKWLNELKMMNNLHQYASSAFKWS